MSNPFARMDFRPSFFHNSIACFGVVGRLELSAATLPEQIASMTPTDKTPLTNLPARMVGPVE
ncbi:MAG: hypothetical protein ABI411_20795 [Tahibacter sp.]